MRAFCSDISEADFDVGGKLWEVGKSVELMRWASNRSQVLSRTIEGESCSILLITPPPAPPPLDLAPASYGAPQVNRSPKFKKKQETCLSLPYAFAVGMVNYGKAVKFYANQAGLSEKWARSKYSLLIASQVRASELDMYFLPSIIFVRRSTSDMRLRIPKRSRADQLPGHLMAAIP